MSDYLIEDEELDEQLYGVHYDVDSVMPEFFRGKLSEMSERHILEVVKDIILKNKNNSHSLHCFRDDTFILNLMNNVPEEDLEKYLINTLKYSLSQECDHKYVLCFRRAIPSEYPKTENFWSTDYSEVLSGLSAEISVEQRQHSVINVTTLDKLEEHGIVQTDRGVSDGEVSIDPNKDFDGIMFRFKPTLEYLALERFLNNGGVTRTEMLERLAANKYERMKAQGLPINIPNQDNGVHI